MNRGLLYTVIGFALILCGFVVFQWQREVKLRREIGDYTLRFNAREESRLKLEGELAAFAEEVKRLDLRKNELTEATGQLRIELRQTQGERDALQRELTSHQAALNKANDGVRQQNDVIKQQNDVIKQQNEQMLRLNDERNEAIVKFNQLTEEFNQLGSDRNQAVEKFNDLVQQFNRLGEERNEVVEKYNKLAADYQSLAEQLRKLNHPGS